MKKRGQISVEYLVVVGFVTFIVLGILGVAFFYSSQIQDTIKFRQIERSASKITSSAESVFFSGEPSRTTFTVYIPDGVKDIQIIENSLVFNVSTSSGEARIAFGSNVPINGTLSASGGVKRIRLVAELDRVTISDAS